MALVMALLVNGLRILARISSHPSHASIGIQSGKSGLGWPFAIIPTGLPTGLLSVIHLPSEATSFAFLGKWECPLRQVGAYHFVRL